MKIAVIITVVISSILLNVVNAELATWSFNGFDSYDKYLEMKRLHIYHGTDHAINNGDGKWYFYRNGWKCSLWNPETTKNQNRL